MQTEQPNIQAQQTKLRIVTTKNITFQVQSQLFITFIINADKASAFSEKACHRTLTDYDRDRLALHIAKKFREHISNPKNPLLPYKIISFMDEIPSEIYTLLKASKHDISEILLPGSKIEPYHTITSFYTLRLNKVEQHEHANKVRRALKKYEGTYTLLTLKKSQNTYTYA